MIWKCPICRGNLREEAATVRCTACAAAFPVIDGIPDLRIPGASWIDFEAERTYARQLLHEMKDAPPQEWLRRVFADQHREDRARTETRTQQVMTGPHRLWSELAGWLRSPASETGLFLDVGCGAGPLLAGAAAAGRQGIGIDVSIVGEPILAAALADALPLEDGAVTGVISLDVIEHVADPRVYLREIDRVLASGGSVALSTPNRFSLTAEPHVFLWGVGWLPRRWQKGYVRWRSGRSYDYVRLLSHRELRALLRSETRLEARIFAPPIPVEEISRFSWRRALLAGAYNRIVSRRGWQSLFLLVGPFFRIVGRKS
jgi:SAM-dependent methyltransferase